MVHSFHKTRKNNIGAGFLFLAGEEELLRFAGDQQGWMGGPVLISQKKSAAKSSFTTGT